MGDAKMLINGALTNYDSGTQTLHKSYFGWEAAGGASATTRVLGGGKPSTSSTSEAALVLFGPNTGFRDKFGNDALRNLAFSARLLIGDRKFTTANNFTSTSRLGIFGDTRFVVSGHLTISRGFFEVSPLTGYARDGDPGFPTTPYLSSQVIVRGNFNLPSPGILRFHILNEAKTATGKRERRCDLRRFTASRRGRHLENSWGRQLHRLTADRISGRFSNVACGGRLNDVYGSFDQFGNPLGDPIGSFRVTYNKSSLVLSNFRAR